jgi:hypothetical protein
VFSIGRHCEERSDEAIQCGASDWIASLSFAMTKQEHGHGKGRKQTKAKDAERRQMHTL